MRIDLDVEEYCQKCSKRTYHETRHERVAGLGSSLNLRSYCLECGHMEQRDSLQARNRGVIVCESSERSDFFRAKKVVTNHIFESNRLARCQTDVNLE